MRRSMRILVVDDNELVRVGVCKTLQSWNSKIVCSEAANGAEAIKIADGFKPTLIILDINMPILGGFQATVELKKIMPQVPILIFSMHDGAQFALEAKRVGAQGFLVKQRAGEFLIEAVQVLHKGESFFF